jgi:hypothetical protein
VFSSSPKVVIIVRKTDLRVLVTVLKAESFFPNSVRYVFVILYGSFENFISQREITWSRLSMSKSIWTPFPASGEEDVLG